jgi:hypothetical protein
MLDSRHERMAGCGRQVRGDQPAVAAPSMGRAAPVMNAASSLSS